MYIYIYTYIHTYIHTHTHAYIYIYTYTYTCVYIYKQIYVCSICIHIYSYMCIFILMCVYIYIYIYTNNGGRESWAPRTLRERRWAVSQARRRGTTLVPRRAPEILQNLSFGAVCRGARGPVRRALRQSPTLPWLGGGNGLPFRIPLLCVGHRACSLRGWGWGDQGFGRRTTQLPRGGFPQEDSKLLALSGDFLRREILCRVSEICHCLAQASARPWP